MEGQPYYEDGVHTPASLKAAPKQQKTGQLVIAVWIVTALVAAALGFIAAPRGGASLRDLSVERILEGCIPIALVSAVGTAEQRAGIQQQLDGETRYYAQQFPDAKNIETRIVDASGVVKERYPEAEYVGVILMDRCV